MPNDRCLFLPDFSVPDLFKRCLPVIFLSLAAACGGGGPETVIDLESDSLRHLPGNGVKQLQIADGMRATLMASEPMLRNPTNIDVDDRGRIWVTEAYNYRPDINGNPTRDAGDRILILEDTTGDGTVDKQTIFYQHPELNAPLGVCVLGNRIIVSQSPYVWVLYDDDGDDRADRREILFQGIGGEQHDHGVHSFSAGPDGKLYFSFGNEGSTLKDKNGKTVTDQDGDPIGPAKYRQGMLFRCDPDGSNVVCLGDNFRNNYEAAVDSYGRIWQSDNDDDGNRGVRINYILTYGNYGYQDEMTGAGWGAARTNIEDSIPYRHWHLNDPGVVPNLLQTGAGSPTGIVYYEGGLLTEPFRNKIIHADAGVNIVRAYPVTANGGGYAARINNLIDGSRNQWFRPADICVAPDGSLIVADWYDPGVGGHQAGDQEKGRIYRIAPAGRENSYNAPRFDYTTVAGALNALFSANLCARYKGYTALSGMGDAALSVLTAKWQQLAAGPMKARLLWLLAPSKQGAKYVYEAAGDQSPEMRILALKVSQQLDNATILRVAQQLSADPDKRVRAECAIALHHLRDPAAAALWAGIASSYEGNDRWYLEALGIGASDQWDEFFGAYLKLNPDPEQSPQGRDIIWRSRGAASLPMLARLAADSGADLNSRLRYFRAFDFSSSAGKSKHLLQIINSTDDMATARIVLNHLDEKSILSSSRARLVLEKILQNVKGTGEYLDLVRRYNYRSLSPELATMIKSGSDKNLSAGAAALLIRFDRLPVITAMLNSGDSSIAFRAMDALGRVDNPRALQLLEATVRATKTPAVIRKYAAARMGGTMAGEDRVLELLAASSIPDDARVDAVEGLKHAWRKAVYLKAKTYLDGSTAGTVAAPPLAGLAGLKPDISSGRSIFSDYCAVCHQVNGEGQPFGPDLSEVGGKLPAEGLYEAIIRPSGGISFGYETWVLDLKDGSKLTGIISSQTESDVELKMPGGVVRKIAASEIKRRQKTGESMMPELHSALTAQQLADLLGFLSELKPDKRK